MSISPWLREILRCPKCLAELRDDTGLTGGPELVCMSDECGLAYRIDDGNIGLVAASSEFAWQQAMDVLRPYETGFAETA